MNWQSGFDHVLTLDAATRERVDEHLASLAEPDASPLPEPDGSIATDPFALAITRDEIIAHLDLGEAAARACLLVVGGDERVALVDGDGQALVLGITRPALEQPAALAVALGQRATIVVARPGQLVELQDLIGGVLAPVAMVTTSLPLADNIAERLQRMYGVEALEGVRDRRRGGWLLLNRGQRGPLSPVRAWDRLAVWGRDGEMMPEAWGCLAHVRASGSIDLFHHQVRRGHTHTGEVEFRVELPRLRIGATEVDTIELSQRLRALPVFSYQLTLGARPKLRLSPQRELGERNEVLRDELADLDGLALEFAPPHTDFDGPIIHDPSWNLEDVVVVVWAGAPDSEARRLGWREAIRASGLSGQPLQVLDSTTKQPLTGLAAEVARELADEHELLASLAPDGLDGRTIFVGDPRAQPDASADAGGWISLLEGSDADEPMFVAGASAPNVGRVRSLFETGELASGPELCLQGVYLHGYTRPMLARGRRPGAAPDAEPLALDAERCTSAGDCVRICPTEAIKLEGTPPRPVVDGSACVRCMLCVERCDTAALRPVVSVDGMLGGEVFAREAGHLVKARARRPERVLDGKLIEPPARLDPRVERAPATIKAKPTVVLGLATVTLMEHTAALLVDGELVSAIEEERLVRERHYTWRHPTRPGVSLSSDICLRAEQAWPPRAIDAVLRTAGLTMDDVDIVALNGVPARFRRSFEGGWDWRAPPILRANSMVFVPHHLSHAASVYGLSDMDEAWILSVDGRGDYETATVWRAEGHDIEIVDAVPWRPDCSFGGVYETFTRALGFGTHGQGSTMALAAYGEPRIDVSSCMGISANHRPRLSEDTAARLVGPYARDYDDELTQAHHDLAASIQLALETTVGDYLVHHTGDLRGKNLALCGGVALNCKMNGVLRERFEPAVMHVPPGANDAGTAIGAAVIGHRELTGELPRLGMGHTHFGPAWSDDAIAASLKRMRVPFQRLRKVGEQVAELLAAGRIVCWFQGPMEFGPRALGGRSITADPRRPELKTRLNAMKSRQDWRPFGPSVLAGHQSEWFMQDWDSRYMLFAIDVRPDKREQIPVVVHHDGSTRPQIVHAEHQPRYHALISAFERRTGVPMIVNTSFNRGGEPIVCNPAEALRSFVGLGADAIVLGDCLVRREMLRRR